MRGIDRRRRVFDKKLVDVANKFHRQVGKGVSLPERKLSTRFLSPFYQLGIAGELIATTQRLVILGLKDEHMPVESLFQVIEQSDKRRAIGKHLKELVCARQETGKKAVLKNSSLFKICDKH